MSLALNYVIGALPSVLIIVIVVNGIARKGIREIGNANISSTGDAVIYNVRH